VTLTLRGTVQLPAHATDGGFDHGDVHAKSGRVFVAHTASNTVEVIDGEHLVLERTLPGCPEGSGVLCTQDDRARVFAAARGDGHVLVFDAETCNLVRRIPVGPRPNGLAWDPLRSRLLVADVEAFEARLVDPGDGASLATARLPGRPRWCVYDGPRDRFLINIREPARLVALDPDGLHTAACIDGLPAGPHGLDLDRTGNRAFVACDAGVVTVIDLTTDREIARVPITGEPDAVWYSDAAEQLYVAVGTPGVIDVIDGQGLTLVEQLSTEEGAHTTAFDQQRQWLYVFLPRTSAAAVYEVTR
jgi:DNA-binding beta-propeller fold protein YncE